MMQAPIEAPTSPPALDGVGAPPSPSVEQPPPPQPDYARDGPYGVVAVHDCLRVARADTGRALRLSLTVTVPAVAPGSGGGGGAGGATDGSRPPPYPVCLLLNGFQARAGQYAPLARRLASHGYAVLQYTNPPLTIVPDGAELPFAAAALGWLKGAAAREANAALYNRADLSNVFVAGHSRGGKLAALHYAAALSNGGRLAAGDSGGGEGGNEGSSGEGNGEGDGAANANGYPVRAAFLMDPVDNTGMTPEGPDYPSACRALAAAGARVGIAAAGVTGATNPEGSNWRQFWAAAAKGSWLGVLPRAGHTRWLMGPWAESWLLDAAFGGGSAPRRAVLDATACLMLGWFERAPPAQRPQRPSLADAAAPACAAADAGAGAGAGAGALVSDQRRRQRSFEADGVPPALAAAAKVACSGGGGGDCDGRRDTLHITAMAAAAATAAGRCPGPCGGGGNSGSEEALPPALAGAAALFESGDLVFEAKRCREPRQGRL